MLKRTLREQVCRLLLLLIYVDGVSTLSSNRPKFCPIVSWETTGTTFANSIMLGPKPYGLFVDKNNTIYANDQTNTRTLIWFNGNNNTPSIILHTQSYSYAIFVRDNGDIFIDNGLFNGRVDKWSRNSTSGAPVMFVNNGCLGLFVDTNNTLYCAIFNLHKVITVSLNDYPNMTKVAAGTGIPGSTSNMLSGPTGIFVDTNFDLYVTDTYNSRIQLFKYGQTSGTTVTQGILLLYPQAIMMDGSGYLYIVNVGQNNIIRSGSNGYDCIIGCTSSNVTQLNFPSDMAFDSYGNLFVMDAANLRIQKFLLATNNSCIQSKTNSSPISVCDLLQACQNNGTCINTNLTTFSYICLCQTGFNGIQCQFDHRLCQSFTCWNGGICNATFSCQCQKGWQGVHCETKINYCMNVTCQNNGVCRSLLGNYTCECLGESFSGRLCEIISKKTVILQTISKSWAGIAIFCILVTAGYIVTMDVLKYFFNIDPMQKKTKEKPPKKKKRKPPIIVRYKYVNSTEHPIFTIQK